jgi:hypothetical protein
VAEVAACSDGVVFFCGLSPEKLVSCYAPLAVSWCDPTLLNLWLCVDGGGDSWCLYMLVLSVS